MAGDVEKFLGDSLARTIIKLVIISLVVGVILAALNITPFEVWDRIRGFFVSLYNLGFSAIENVLQYFVWGAMIVVPIFILLRLLKFGR